MKPDTVEALGLCALLAGLVCVWLDWAMAAFVCAFYGAFWVANPELRRR